MPELPEVEVTRRSFSQPITGARIVSAQLGKPLRWPLGCTTDILVGQLIHGVRRRGKYLVLQLDRGVLLIHLGMSGSLRFESTPQAARVHDHFELKTTTGTLRLNDPRRFGAVVYSMSEAADPAQKLLGALGMEPLEGEFHLAEFRSGLKRSSAAIKQVLLAGRLVVGVGNIYASEALFAARIHPAAPADGLGVQQVKRLHLAIIDVLDRAIRSGGSTLRNFSSAAGVHGRYQNLAQVYGRAGEPCTVCEATIQMIRQGQRSTFFCPKCQPLRGVLPR